MNQVKESGKENSPPHEVIGAEELLTNGHASPEEMVTLIIEILFVPQNSGFLD